MRSVMPAYFLHVPKCAGYSVFDTLQYDAEQLGLKYNICNHFSASVSGWDEWLGAEACGMHATESTFSPGIPPQKQYTMVRSPSAHVVSMFYHCKESADHAYKKKLLMPDTIEEWLLKSEPSQLFDCYNPSNLQTARLGGVDDLDHKFAVVGLTEEFVASTCLMSIHLHGAVPERCNCTETTGQQKHGLYIPHHSHSVTHHGDSPVSSFASKLIKERIRDDEILYTNAVSKLKKDLDVVEKRYDVQLCRT